MLAHLPGRLLISFTENSLPIFGGLGPNLRSDITKESTMTGGRSKEKRNTSAHISCLMQSGSQEERAVVCSACTVSWGGAEW